MSYTPINFDKFRKRLIELRVCQNKSRKIVSELCGLQPDMVRRYECGESLPSFESLVALADYFEVSLDYLAGRSDKK